MFASNLRFVPAVFLMSLGLAAYASAMEPDRLVVIPETAIVGSVDEFASLPPPPPDGLDHLAKAAYYDARAKEYAAAAQSSWRMESAARIPGNVIYGERYVVRYYQLQARGFDNAADRSRTLSSTHREQERQAAALITRAPRG